MPPSGQKRRKTWTYAEITAVAEAKIKRYMAHAELNQVLDAAGMKAENQADQRTAHTIRQWAYGVYDSWYEITMGWQNPGDDDRLKKLTEQVRSSAD